MKLISPLCSLTFLITNDDHKKNAKMTSHLDATLFISLYSSAVRINPLSRLLQQSIPISSKLFSLLKSPVCLLPNPA
jgi:hypothetical protein